MKKNVLWRFLLIGALSLAALVYLLPDLPVYQKLPNWWKSTMPSRGMTLGLDLQGGLHLVFEVEGDRAVEISVERLADALKEDLADKGIEAETTAEGTSIDVKPDTDAVRKFIEDRYSVLEPAGQGRYRLIPREVTRIKDDSVDQALETIRNRIDQFGVAEPAIQRQGTNEIVVQLPGVKDPKRAIDLIGKTAQLEFRMLDENAPLAVDLPQSITPNAEDQVREQFADRVPEGDELMFEVNRDTATGEIISKTPLLVKKKVELTGDLLSEANVAIDQRFNEPYVSLRFNPAGANRFEEVTAANVQKRMAIILDGTVYSAPVIREKIAGGNAQISGRFTLEEARDLAIVLKAGALPAPMKLLQNVTVGPSLGRDSIEAGKVAGLIGAILVVVFMVFYYRLAGLIADLALVLNILLLLGAMAMLEATLTLPGIAGIILAIGMAVDSNVLMFERMREELRAGKTPRAAVDSGYDKAFWTIFDSHVTTLITAVVLFQFGTGPIKGFAVTLSFGVAINLFTALVGTKTVFDFVNSRREVKSLSI
ncbi:MAG: protein translocase subunit SecD [Nitrospirota bacterium]